MARYEISTGVFAVVGEMERRLVQKEKSVLSSCVFGKQTRRSGDTRLELMPLSAAVLSATAG